MGSNPAKRAVLVGAVVICVLTALSARVVHLQLVQHWDLARLAMNAHLDRIAIPAMRGSIIDRSGGILASSQPVYDILFDGQVIRDRQKFGDVLVQYLPLEEDDLRARLETQARYVPLYQGLSDDKASQLRSELAEIKERALIIEERWVRIYPHNKSLGHVLGYLTNNAVGSAGIELSMNEELSGRHGFRYVERDAKRREIVSYRGYQEPPDNGRDVALTIDMTIQDYVEREMDHAFEELNAEGMSVVVLRVGTGEVLAMSSRPHYDPNSWMQFGDEERRNRAIAASYTPGSVMKIVAVSGALSHGLVQFDSEIYCENGRWEYAGTDLVDHRPFGYLPVRDILPCSTNIGTAKLAVQLGARNLYSYLLRYGFRARTGIELPGEESGILRPFGAWTDISVTRIPIGQEIDVTPLQMAAAMSVIANRGMLVSPRIVLQVTDAEGEVLRKHRPVRMRQVIAPAVADLIRESLALGVTESYGTARRAGVEGYRVAGKTGTAQKVHQGGFQRGLGKNILTFAGFAPLEEPEVVIMVLIDEPRPWDNTQSGGTVAAPIFSRLVARIMRHLGIPPQTLEESPILEEVAAPDTAPTRL
ncbi:MAG: peptidoglycan D,D-transpeptidase FtsI family protein [Verrucomicrobiales bacterium]